MQQRLGEILCADHVLAPAQVETALRRAAATRSRLGTALLELRMVDADQLAAALARQHGLPAARDKHFAGIADQTRGLLPGELAHRHGAVPIGVVNGGTELVVAMRDPNDVVARQTIAVATGYKVRPAAAGEVRINKALTEMYGPAKPAPVVVAPIPERRDPYFTPPPVRPPSVRPPPPEERKLVVGNYLRWLLVAFMVADVLACFFLGISKKTGVALALDVLVIDLLRRGRPLGAGLAGFRFAASWWYLYEIGKRLPPQYEDLHTTGQVYCLLGLVLSFACTVIPPDDE